MKPGIWHDEVGSLHLAYQDDELQVLEEYAAANSTFRETERLPLVIRMIQSSDYEQILIPTSITAKKYYFKLFCYSLVYFI